MAGNGECGEEGESEGLGGRAALWLDCDFGVNRGSHGECEVRAQSFSYRDSLEFEWQAHGGMVPEWMEQEPRWGGYATETRRMGVQVTHPSGKMEILTGTVTIRPRGPPRGWGLEQQNARTKPQWVDTIPGGGTPWGRYRGGYPSPATLFVSEGSGPWKNSYYVSSAPSIADATMYLHKDLVSDGKAYPIHPEKDTAAIDYCKPNLDGYDSLGVYHLNAKCNEAHKRKIEDFRGKVVAHENRHETSLNKCIRTVNFGLLAQIEEIVRKGPEGRSDVKVEAEKLWTDSAYAALLDAKETAQGAVVASIWKHRPGPTWKYSVQTIGHGGTEGCPGL